MTAFAPGFSSASVRIRNDHRVLADLLDHLEAALGRLESASNASDALSVLEPLRHAGHELAAKFPGHSEREESCLLEPVTSVSAELRDYCAGLKGEHCVIRELLKEFLLAVDSPVNADNPSAAFAHLIQVGSNCVAELRRHLASEQEELSGFL